MVGALNGRPQFESTTWEHFQPFLFQQLCYFSQEFGPSPSPSPSEIVATKTGVSSQTMMFSYP